MIKQEKLTVLFCKDANLTCFKKKSTKTNAFVDSYFF